MSFDICHYPFYHKLKIPIPDRTPGSHGEILLDLKNENNRQLKIKINQNIWADNVIYWKLKSINLYPSLIRYFYWKKDNIYYPWHIDGDGTTVSKISMNWIISGQGKIQWNPDIDLDYNKESGVIHAVNNNSLPEDDFCSEIDGNGYLVNTAIPHRVVNNENQSRFTLTLQFFTSSTLGSFDDVLRRLKSVDLLY